MKKTLLILAAIVLVASGVAAVSAYEAHTVNVKAHVENALELTITESDFEFGTLFPEEWTGAHFDISLSQSAKDEITAQNLTSVNFTVYAEWKEDDRAQPNTAHWWDATIPGWVSTSGYYNWLGECLYVKDGSVPDATSDPVVGAALAGPPSAQTTPFSYMLDGQQSATLYVYIDTPVFEGSYNDLTDALANPGGIKQSGRSTPTWIIDELGPDGLHNELHQETGLDLGLDLKMQVTSINRP